MATRTNKSIFYHIPKTGGVWVLEALRLSIKDNSDSMPREAEAYYDVVDDLTYWKRFAAHMLTMKWGHETQWGVAKKDRDGLFSYAFVRKPVSWYKSYWIDRKIDHARKRFNTTWPPLLLDAAWDVDFEKFVKNALKMFPMGALTVLYRCFLGKDGDELDFVGKQENLKEDFIEALTLAGEEFDEKAIRELKKLNVKASKEKSDEFFDIGSDLKNALEKRERWITNTFYK